VAPEAEPPYRETFVTENLLKDRARRMRREPTDAEGKLWRILRGGRLGGHKFRRQEPIGPYIVDFACHRRKLAIELDGSQHAGSARDVEREAWLRARGFETLRFWNNEVLTNPDGVAHAIAMKLGLDWLA
jgi:very-short-patch-repair endonuclease